MAEVLVTKHTMIGTEAAIGYLNGMRAYILDSRIGDEMTHDDYFREDLAICKAIALVEKYGSEEYEIEVEWSE